MADDKKISELPLFNGIKNDDFFPVVSDNQTGQAKIGTLIENAVSPNTRNAIAIDQNGKMFVEPLTGAEIDLDVIEVTLTDPPDDETLYSWINVAGYKVKAHPTNVIIPAVVFPNEIPRIIPEINSLAVAHGKTYRVRFVTLNSVLLDNFTVTATNPNAIQNMSANKFDDTGGYIDFTVNYPNPVYNGSNLGLITIENGLFKTSFTVTVYMPATSVNIVNQTVTGNQILTSFYSQDSRASNIGNDRISAPIISLSPEIDHRVLYVNSGFDGQYVTSYSGSSSAHKVGLVNVIIDEPYTGEIIFTMTDQITGLSSSKLINYP